ncbi:hypothetical protein [Deinococcus aquiradiocola]|uniref:Uncharacterized protein n=1 Tax=Deinococcus aquiradiocola TaxID=393059 RepID=A0A917P7C8_9DEIO|nr:hypothetical protein [Deinococcus aquiradiocola]GGJ65133.1 hypothetical protein GCM10008939_06270 [Deinococcus aquiradiocola]
MSRIDAPGDVQSPVTLHPLDADRALIGVRLACPDTGAVVTAVLTPAQQRALLVHLQAHLDRQPAPDPHAERVASLARWRDAHRDGPCPDCDPTPAPCICEIAEPLIGRTHTADELASFQGLDDALNGRR